MSDILWLDKQQRSALNVSYYKVLLPSQHIHCLNNCISHRPSGGFRILHLQEPELLLHLCRGISFQLIGIWTRSLLQNGVSLGGGYREEVGWAAAWPPGRTLELPPPPHSYSLILLICHLKKNRAESCRKDTSEWFQARHRHHRLGLSTCNRFPSLMTMIT